MTTSVKRSVRGAESTSVKAASPLLDLGNGVVQRLEASGVRTLTFALLSFQRQELVDRILQDAPATFSRGVIEDPTTVVSAFTFDGDSPLSALQELAEIEGLQLGIRRDGPTGFLVDMVTNIGDLASYGEIPATNLGDANMKETTPTTNFGTDVDIQVFQPSAGTTNVKGVIRFDLRSFLGLGLTVKTARLIFRNTGGGTGTAHLVGMRVLKRNTPEAEVTWDDANTGEAWSIGGAGDSTDKDVLRAWEKTIADNTDGAEIVEFPNNPVAGTQTFAQLLQTVIDGTETFFGDGILRLLFENISGGQATKRAAWHSRDSVTIASRPQLLIEFTRIRPRFIFRKNIQGIERETEDRDLATRIYPIGAGGEQSGVRVTVGRARWTVASTPSTTTLTLTETAIFEDDHLKGDFLERLSDGTKFEIDTTDVSSGVITTTAAHGLSPGDAIIFRDNASGDELVFVESPSAQANFGIVNAVIAEDDLPSVDNLVVNPAFRNFTDIGGGQFLADGWNKVGSPVVTKETDSTLVSVAGAGQRIVAGIGEGIESDLITVAPVDPDIFFYSFIQLFIESGGGVEFTLEHSTQGKWPPKRGWASSRNSVTAKTTKQGIMLQVTIEGKEFPAGTVKLIITAIDAATTFIVDAAQLENAGFEQPFFEGRARVKLWQRGLDALAIRSIPIITHKIPNALDLTGALPADFPYDQVLLGAPVVIDDEQLAIDNVDARVLSLTEELLESKTLSMELSNSKEDLIDRLTKLKRRGRKMEGLDVPLPDIAMFKADVDDEGEVIIWFQGSDQTLSFKFLVGPVGGPAPTYQEVVDTGISSDLIDGEKVFTGELVQAGETVDVRVVAFGLLAGAGRAGSSETRTISQPPPIGSTVRARVFRSTDLTVLNADAGVKEEWDLEDVDIGNLHSPTPPKNEHLKMNLSTGRWLSLVQVDWDAAGSGVGNRELTVFRQGGLSPTDDFFTSRAEPGGQLVHQAYGLEILPQAGGIVRTKIFQDSAVTKTVRAARSFFSILRLPINKRRPRVYVSGSITKSFPAATDTNVDWIGANDEEGGTWFSGGTPDRITVPTGAGGPLLLIAQALIITTAAINAGVHGARIRKNGTTNIGRWEIPNQGSVSGILAVQQPVMILDLGAVATDFYEHELRQEFGATVAIQQVDSQMWALRLQAGTNPRAEVSKSALQTITTSTPTAVTWQNEDVDVGGIVDLGSFATRITFNFIGMVLGIAQIDWQSNGTGVRRIFLRKNGDDLEIDPPWEVLEEGPGTGNLVMQLVFWLDVTDSDFIEIFVEQQSGGNLDVQAADSKLQVIRVADA